MAERTPAPLAVTFHLAPNGFGGAEVYARALMAELAADPGLAVSAAVADDEAGRALMSRLTGDYQKTFTRPFRRSRYPLWWLAARRLVKRPGMLVINQAYPRNSLETLAMAVKRGRPTVCLLHGRGPEEHLTPALCRKLGALYAKSHSVQCVSEDMRRFLIERLGLAPTQVQVLGGFFEPARVQVSPEKAAALRARLLAGADGPLFVTTSRFAPGKRWDLTLEAMKQVAASAPGARIAMLGDGPELEAARRRAAELGLSGCVSFAGFQESVADFLGAADALVLLSDAEGMPLSMIEAMACRRPVVATRVGGIPEAVIDGENGFLVEPGEAGAAARAMLLLCSQKNRRTLGEAAERTANWRFTLRSVAERMKSVLRAAASAGGSGT